MIKIETYKGIDIYNNDGYVWFREGNKIGGKIFKSKSKISQTVLENAYKTIDLYINV